MHYPLYDFAESANRTRAVLQLPHAAAPFVCRKANDKGALVRKKYGLRIYRSLFLLI